MAFERSEPITLDICADCLHHLANGEGGCCHVDYVAGVDVATERLRRPEWHDHLDVPAGCPTALRLERRHRDVEGITLGCTDEECGSCRSEESTDPWFSHSACDGCGVNLYGDRWHATAWVRVPRVVTIKRNGWTVEFHLYARGPWIAATRAGDLPRSAFNLPRDGSQRFALLYMFVATLPA